MQTATLEGSKSSQAAVSAAENNKRIAGNTILLYIRLAFMMAIGFVTTRKLLHVLGVVDYGLVNVIGGVVTMFSSLSTTMSAAASRFYNYEMGRGDWLRLKQTFNLTQLIYASVLIVLLALAESVGLWTITHKLAVPLERQEAAAWFFQFAVAAFLVNVAITPYRALLLAHENMKAFAWLCVGEAATGLAGVYLLAQCTQFDQLIIYGGVTLLTAVLLFSAYFYVCWFGYPESRFGLYWNPKEFRELVAFSGWNMFGALSGLFGNVLVNLVLNNFFGPAINAARGLALQLSAAISSFGQNFMTAVNPQIIKYHASGRNDEMHTLALQAARFGYFLLLLPVLPSMMEMEFVLHLWLAEVPAHTVLFAQLALLKVLIDVISLPLLTVAQATGRIALYQCVVGGMLWMNLPLSYLALRAGAAPEATMLVAVGVASVCFVLRIFCVRRTTGLSFGLFFREGIARICATTVSAAIAPLCIVLLVPPGWSRSIFIGGICVASTGAAIFVFGIKRGERHSVLELVKSKVGALGFTRWNKMCAAERRRE